MNKYILGIISIIIIIIASIFILISNQDQTNEKEIVEEINKTEFLPGDFRIDKTQYNIGEKIFLDMDYIGSGDKGTVYILRPLNDTHRITYMIIPFSGENKDSFNYYFEAKLDEEKRICSMDDLDGIWSIVFDGTNYPNIEFEVKNQISNWDERNYDPIC